MSAKDAQAIREGSDDSSVSVILNGTGTEIEVKLSRSHRKKALLNGLGLPRASDLLGRLPCVSFSARDLDIAKGGPSDRRDFLDEELAQLYPAYLKNLTLYKRAVEQRNHLLKIARNQFVHTAEFEPWEQHICESGNAIRRMRQEWLLDLVVEARQAHAFLGSGETLELQIQENDEGLSLDRLTNTRLEDIHRGSTSLGPHRDEMLILVGGMEARGFGSQGQQRTSVIALKLGVQALAKRLFGQPPVLLLDDVFSDLDATRRSRLVEHAMTEGGQVFLTCTEAEMAGKELLSRSTLFKVRSGEVEKQ